MFKQSFSGNVGGLLDKYFKLEPRDSKVLNVLLRVIEEECGLTLSSEDVEISSKGDVLFKSSPLIKHCLHSHEEEIRRRFSEALPSITLGSLR